MWKILVVELGKTALLYVLRRIDRAVNQELYRNRYSKPEVEHKIRIKKQEKKRKW